jgi:hypothetical protein
LTVVRFTDLTPSGLLLLDDATVAIEQKHQNGDEGQMGLEHFATRADFITPN